MCDTGGGNTQAGGPAPTALLGAANNIFKPLPYPNTSQAASNAYSSIGGMNTNPAAQYGGAAAVGQNLTGIGGGLAAQAPGYINAFGNLGNQANTQGQQYSQQFNALGGQANAQGQAYQNLFNNFGNQIQQSGAPAFNAGMQTYQQNQPYAAAALQAGFDPQNALYNRTQQQNQDQMNAQNAMSGVASSPYGAGLANQANSNFNIDWQNQQLQRQQLGASTAAGLENAGNQALQGGTSALQAGYGQAGTMYGLGSNAGQTGLTNAGNLYNMGSNAAQTGATNAGNLYGQGANATATLAGAGGNLATQGLQMGQSIDTQQYNAQQQQFQDYMSYLNQNAQNSQAYFGAANNTYNQALNGANLNNSAANSRNAAFSGGLQGIGSAVGAALPFFML